VAACFFVHFLTTFLLFLPFLFAQPPVYSPDLQAYDRALESFIGLNASTHELSHSEMETRMNKAYTIQVRSTILPFAVKLLKQNDLLTSFLFTSSFYFSRSSRTSPASSSRTTESVWW